MLNDGDDDSCGAGKPGGRCSSTAARCSSDNTEIPRNNYVGNTHYIPDIRSRNDMRDNRRLLRLLLSRLKPERQLVLLEPEPVRSLSMEVKEVFSLGPPIYEFQFVALKDANSWDGAHGRM